MIVFGYKFEPYRVTTQHTDESFNNLLKIHHLIEAHPDIALLEQLSPAFCGPSLVTQAMIRHIRKRTGCGSGPSPVPATPFVLHQVHDEQ